MTLEGILNANPNAYPSLALVRVDVDVDVDGAADDIAARIAVAMSNEYPDEIAPELAAGYQDLRPSEVVGLAPASRTANLLAGLLGAASVLALGLTLSSSVRRRRRTDAVRSAIGLDRGDLRQTVRWQVNLVTLLALAVGLPIGVVLGRIAWIAFAEQLGVASDPQLPLALLAAAAAGLLLLANLVGEWPARTAGRRRQSIALRGLG
jgi:predicted lysophospholipase L1 biosynthesis ABC-type transport system permease subunit